MEANVGTVCSHAPSLLMDQQLYGYLQEQVFTAFALTIAKAPDFYKLARSVIFLHYLEVNDADSWVQMQEVVG